MNARVPMYTGPTDNPIADAANWEDDRDCADELQQEAERQAPLIILSKLQAIIKPEARPIKHCPGLATTRCNRRG